MNKLRLWLPTALAALIFLAASSPSNQVTYSDLEAQAWTEQTGTNVNPVPADLFAAYPQQDGSLEVVNASSKALGGALVTLKIPPPSLSGVTFTNGGFDGQLWIGQRDLTNLGRLELDAKICLTGAPNSSTPIANVVNASSQLNLSTGQWQIDGNPPGWLNTGFAPTLTAEQWIPFSFRYAWNGTTFSFVSASFGGQSFTVPASMQNVPLETTNWQPVIALQIQTEVLQPGAVSVFFKGLRFAIADGAVQ